MDAVMKELRKLVARPWAALASVLGLLMVAALSLGMSFPSEVAHSSLEWLGISSTWPQKVHGWMNAPRRHDGLRTATQFVLAGLVMAHAAHAWSRGGDDDFYTETLNSTQDREESLKQWHALADYNAGRSSQTYASLWVAIAIYAELDELTVSSAAAIVVLLALGTLLDFRSMHPRDWPSAVPLTLGVEALMALMALVSLPLGLATQLILPTRSST